MKFMVGAIVKKYFKLLLSLAITASLGFALLSGLSSGYQSLDYSLSQYLYTYQYPDAFLSTEVTSVSEAEKILQINGVKACDTRLCGNSMLKTDGGDYYSIRLFSYREDEHQGFYYWGRSDSGGKDGVLLEYHFAKNHSIHAGDKVYFKIRDEYRPFFVEGIISRPETLHAKISDRSWGINYDFGYAYASIDLLAKEYEKDSGKTKKELDENEAQLKDERSTAEGELREKEEELESAKKTVADHKEELYEAEEKVTGLKETKEELLSAQKELEQKRTELDALTQSTKDQREELLKQRKLLLQAKDGLEQIGKGYEEAEEMQDVLTRISNSGVIPYLGLLPQDVCFSDLVRLYEEQSSMRSMEAADGVYVFSEMEEESTGWLAGAEEEAVDEFTYVEETAGEPYSNIDEEITAYTDEELGDLPPDTGEDPEDFLPDGVEELEDLFPYAADEITELLPYVEEEAEELFPYVEDNLEELYPLVEEGIEEQLPYTKEELQKQLNSFRSYYEMLFPDKELEDLTAGEVVSRYNAAQSEVTASFKELDSQKKRILTELNKYNIKEDGIDSAVDSIDDGIRQCDEGLEQIREGYKELSQGETRIREGLKEIDSLLPEIEAQIVEGKKELASAQVEIRSSERELRQSSAEILKEFANMEDELDRAYRELDESEGYDHLCNQFLLYLDEGADADGILTQAERVLLKDLSVTSSYTFADSPVKERIDQNLDPFQTLSVFCPAIFYLVTLGIIFLFMSMIMKQSRREIGILRALGFSKNKVRGIFCFVSVFVALLGVLIGAVIAYGIMHYIGSYFAAFFPLPAFYYRVSLWTSTAGAALTVAICLIATLITTGAISRVAPKEAMSRPVLQKVSIPVWIRALTNHLRPIDKFSVTSLLRNKGRFLFSAACTAASVMLIFSAVSFIAAKNHVIAQTFTDRIHYDCQIYFENALDPEQLKELKSLGYLTDVQELLYYDTDLAAGDEIRSGVINAVEEDTSLVSIYDTSGDLRSVRGGEIIVERHLAKELHAQEGDTLTVNGVQLRIGAISDQCANYTHYISLADADRIGAPDLYCLICNLPKDKYSALLAYLTENAIDGYLYTTFMQPFFAYNIELYNTYDMAAWILIAFAVVLGFVIIINTMMTNLQELKKELCILRALGFQNREISRSRFSHAILQFLIAVPIGLVSGFFFAKEVLLRIGSETEEYVFSSGLKEYVVSIGIVFAYLLFGHLLTMHRMKKWNIAESGKEKE